MLSLAEAEMETVPETLELLFGLVMFTPPANAVWTKSARVHKERELVHKLGFIDGPFKVVTFGDGGVPK